MWQFLFGVGLSFLPSSIRPLNPQNEEIIINDDFERSREDHDRFVYMDINVSFLLLSSHFSEDLKNFSPH